MKKHFVVFFSPGTITAERTVKPIESWDVETAVEMSYGIKERYNATPFGFRFITKEREDGELDSHETERSGMYYLGGKILTLDEIKERSNPADKILISNMKGNNWNIVVENSNSWRWTQPLGKDDMVLDYDPSKRKDAT